MTETRDDYSLQRLINDAIDELNEYHKDNPDEDATDTEIHEIADGFVPIYTSDLLQYAAHNVSLALDTPEIGPAFDGSATPVNIIAANIYEAVYNALGIRWQEILDEDEDDA